MVGALGATGGSRRPWLTLVAAMSADLPTSSKSTTSRSSTTRSSRLLARPPAGGAARGRSWRRWQRRRQIDHAKTVSGPVEARARRVESGIHFQGAPTGGRSPHELVRAVLFHVMAGRRVRGPDGRGKPSPPPTRSPARRRCRTSTASTSISAPARAAGNGPICRAARADAGDRPRGRAA